MDVPETASSKEPGVVTAITKHHGQAPLFMGKVVAGIVRVGDKVLFHPRSGATAEITSVGMEGNNEVMSAAKGDYVGFKVSNVQNGPVHRRDIMMVIPSEIEMETRFKTMTKKVKQFTVRVDIIDKQFPRAVQWYSGFSPTMYIGGIQCTASLAAINWVKEGNINDDSKVEKPDQMVIARANSAELVFGPCRCHPVQDRVEIMVMTPNLIEGFSRVLIFPDGKEMTMAGVVTNVLYKE